MNGVFRFLGSRPATIICLVVALFCRMVQVFYYYRLGGDQTIILQRARNLLEGNGLSITRYFVAQPEMPILDPTPYFPPGYSLIVAPFLALFDYDLVRTTLFVDILINIGLLAALWKLCFIIGLPPYARNLFILVAGTFQYVFITRGLPTDTVSLLCVILATTALIKTVANPHSTRPNIYFSGFLFFLPTLFRYAYAPVSIFFPLFLIAGGLYSRNRKLTAKGSLALLVTTLLLVGMFTFQHATGGSATYQLPMEPGYFPENLLAWYPFIASAFLNLDLLCSKIAYFSSIPYESAFRFFELFNVIGVMILLALSLMFLKKHRNTLVENPQRTFVVFGFLLSGLIILALGWLSFTNRNFHKNIQRWNFVYEGRYFAFIFIYLQLLVIGSLESIRRKTIKQSIKVVVITLLGFILLTCLHSIYYTVRTAINFTAQKKIYRVDSDYARYLELADSIRHANPGIELFTASTDGTYNDLAIITGNKSFADARELNRNYPGLRGNAWLLLVIYKENEEEFRELISNRHAILVDRVEATSFYLFKR